MIDFHYELKGARRKAFRVQGDVCCIGSARNNDLVLDAKTVGKRHAELRMKTDGVHIRDRYIQYLRAIRNPQGFLSNIRSFIRV